MFHNSVLLPRSIRPIVLKFAVLLLTINLGLSGKTYAGGGNNDVPIRESDESAEDVPKAMDLKQQILEAIDMLASKLEIDTTEITIRNAESIVWPDGSLGCPRPGVIYTQALVQGSLIVLQAEGRTYHYHATRNQLPFYCARAVIRPPGEGSSVLK